MDYCHSKPSFRAVSWRVTLVVLLVIIAIVALLIAMLLPTFTRARGTATRLTGLTNPRAMMLATFVYINGDDQTRPHWSWHSDYLLDASPTYSPPLRQAPS